MQAKLWTIGHSTRSGEEFLPLIREYEISVVADVRLYPGSNRYPQFNRDALRELLSASEVDYVHLRELGGRRKPRLDSRNTAWRNEGFRGYADYMETKPFAEGIVRLRELVPGHGRLALMCAEAVWWRCHRSLIC